MRRRIPALLYYITASRVTRVHPGIEHNIIHSFLSFFIFSPDILLRFLISVQISCSVLSQLAFSYFLPLTRLLLLSFFSPCPLFGQPFVRFRIAAAIQYPIHYFRKTPVINVSSSFGGRSTRCRPRNTPTELSHRPVLTNSPTNTPTEQSYKYHHH